VIVGLVVACHVAGAPHQVYAQSTVGIVPTVTYTGALGPVSSAWPLCLCVYTDPELKQIFACYISDRNGAKFQLIGLDPGAYYFIAFLDPNFDERPNPSEPSGIYRNRTTPPADPVTAAPDLPTIDITFGDESLTPAATPPATSTATPSAPPTETLSPTATPSSTATPSPSPTAPASPTPSAARCAGDCDGSGEVTVNELLTLVNIALGNAPLTACPGGDTDGSNAIEVTEILAAVNNALAGCGSAFPGG
jgi:hypothetical protein